MIIAGTGHRPKGLEVIQPYGDDVYWRLVDLAKAALQKHQSTKVISGMALGWDQALAEAAIQLEIPVDAYIPFRGYENNWPESSQERYHDILESDGVKTVLLDRGGYSPRKLFARNERMVSAADCILALWDGKPGSGTAHAIQTALKSGKKVINLWASWKKHGPGE